MAEQSAISWTDSTVNFWLGCTEVSPACDRCYARELVTTRMGKPDAWSGKRYKTKGAYVDPLRWQKKAAAFEAERGHRRRIFTNSLADFFDNEVDPAWREEAWRVIYGCFSMDWYIVTKRVSNIMKMLPFPFIPENFRHCIFIATIVTQAEADRDIPRLIEFKKRYPWVRIGLSMEPLIERVDLVPDWLEMLDWVIVGGESGAGARFMEMDWALRIMDVCRDFKVPFHFKQVGSNHEGFEPFEITGAGKDPAQWPEPLQYQQFPRAA